MAIMFYDLKVAVLPVGRISHEECLAVSRPLVRSDIATSVTYASHIFHEDCAENPFVALEDNPAFYPPNKKN